MKIHGIPVAASLLLVGMLTSCTGGGYDNGTGPGSALSVTLRNNHTQEIQIVAPNEVYADGNRIPAGGTRVVSVADARVGGNVMFRVGRNNQDIAALSCPMARDTRNPEVRWDGSALQCINW